MSMRTNLTRPAYCAARLVDHGREPYAVAAVGREELDEDRPLEIEDLPGEDAVRYADRPVGEERSRAKGRLAFAADGPRVAPAGDGDPVLRPARRAAHNHAIARIHKRNIFVGGGSVNYWGQRPLHRQSRDPSLLTSGGCPGLPPQIDKEYWDGVSIIGVARGAPPPIPLRALHYFAILTE